MPIPRKKIKPKKALGRMQTSTRSFQRNARPCFAVAGGAIEDSLPGSRLRLNLSEAQTTALQRLNLLLRYRQLRADGMAAPDAAKACGSSIVTLWRYGRAFDSGGLESLQSRHDRCGRNPVADRSGLTPSLLKELQAICLALGSSKRGYQLFAQLPQCPPNLAKIVRRAKSIPPSLKHLVALKTVTLAGIQSGNQIQLTQQQEIAP